MIDPKDISCCLITKDAVYPKIIIDSLADVPFGEVLILTHSDSPHRKHELFAKAKHDFLYYQDDDAICPVEELLTIANPAMINVAMKPHHFESYSRTRMTMGLGWGSIFPKALLASLKRYTAVYGEDPVYKRETERIFTYLNFPQNRLILPIEDLPSAMAPDRLSMAPGHYSYIPVVEERCRALL